MDNRGVHQAMNSSGPPGTYGCACQAADARLCYIVRHDLDPAEDPLDDGRCECLCHEWRDWDDLYAEETALSGGNEHG